MNLAEKILDQIMRVETSVNRLGDLLNFVQLFKAFGNN